MSEAGLQAICKEGKRQAEGFQPFFEALSISMILSLLWCDRWWEQAHRAKRFRLKTCWTQWIDRGDQGELKRVALDHHRASLFSFSLNSFFCPGGPPTKKRNWSPFPRHLIHPTFSWMKPIPVIEKNPEKSPYGSTGVLENWSGGSLRPKDLIPLFLSSTPVAHHAIWIP